MSVNFRLIPLLSIVLISSTDAKSQHAYLRGSISLLPSYSGKVVPFWFRANQFGSVPLPGPAVGAIAAVRKDYDSINSLIDWGAGLEIRGNAGKSLEGDLIEGYLKLKISIFEIRAGRSKEVMGLADSTLSTGNFSESGNSLPIPKVEVAIPDYWTIPIFDELFAVKGKLVHGWIGDAPVTYGKTFNVLRTYFHQASLYGRLGRPEWRLHLYGGVNHEVFWGSERVTYGKQFDLSWWQTFLKVAAGRTWNRSKIGNQLGSIDQAIEYDFDNSNIYFYHEFIYDIGALFHFANLGDGLYGLRVTNKRYEPGKLSIDKIVGELFLTKNQAGEPSSKITPSGDENYYNNDFYRNGWTYKNRNIGNPFITAPSDARPGFPNAGRDYYLNNRVVVFHLAGQGSFGDIDFTSKLSYSLNFGTYGTSHFGHSLRNTRERPAGYFDPTNQFSGYFELSKMTSSQFRIGIACALDIGGLLPQSGGVIFKITRSFGQ